MPDKTKLLDQEGDTIPFDKISKTTSGKVQLANDYNSIGIIDGQHRVFSYHEGGTEDKKVNDLRSQQNLLVTGVLFPKSFSEDDRARLEARLFLDINSNQSNAKANLKQEIGLITRPFAVESIARKVLGKLNDENGPLNGEFEKYFWDKDKIKNTSIVSYGLVPIVRIGTNESLFSVWQDPDREKLIKPDAVKPSPDKTRDAYITFCVKEINMFISAAKANLPAGKWTANKKVEGHLLSTTFVNGLIACLRQMIPHGKLADFESYKASFSKLDGFDFSTYKSSHYNALGRDLSEKFFGIFQL